MPEEYLYRCEGKLQREFMRIYGSDGTRRLFADAMHTFALSAPEVRLSLTESCYLRAIAAESIARAFIRLPVRLQMFDFEVWQPDEKYVVLDYVLRGLGCETPHHKIDFLELDSDEEPKLFALLSVALLFSAGIEVLRLDGSARLLVTHENMLELFGTDPAIVVELQADLSQIFNNPAA